MNAGLGALDASHRERIAEIVRGTGAFADDEVAIALEVFDDAIRPDADGDYELLGAFDDAGIVSGYAAYGLSPGTDGAYDLYWIAVDSKAQRGGTGSLLIRGIEQVLAPRGARLLIAETSSRDAYEDTRMFYVRRGFVEACRVREYYAAADDLVVFVKRLNNARQDHAATQ